MIENSIDVLKSITTQVINYANYSTVIDSVNSDSTEIDADVFFEETYDFSPHSSNEDNILVLQSNDIEIASALKTKTNIKFGLNCSYLLEDSTISSVIVEITDFVFNPEDDHTINIKDFYNTYLKYVLTGFANLFSEFEMISNEEDNKDAVYFGNDLVIQYVLSADNGVHLSIKSLFVNDVDVVYSISTSKDLVDLYNDIAPEAKAKIEEIISNTGNLVSDLWSYDNDIIDVNVDELQSRFQKTIQAGAPTTNAQLVKELIYYSILRSGVSSISNLLALYDDTNYLSVNSVIYSIELER